MAASIIRIATLLAAMLGAWQPSTARAAEDDTQFWVLGFVRGNLADGVFLVVDTSLRQREPQIGPDQQTVRVTLEQGFAGNRMRLGGGFAIFETAGQTEFRPHQQFRYVRGGLDLRTRFEQRLFPGTGRAELRIRQRVQYTHEASQRADIIGSAEWFGVVQGRDADTPTGTEQLRLILAAAFEVGGGFELQPGYLMVIAPGRGEAQRISHIPQVAINYRF